MKSLTAMLLAISEKEAGELPRTWHQCTEQDKWETAFSAGLLSAIEEINLTLLEQGGSPQTASTTGEEG